MFAQLEAEIKHLCANPTFTRRRPPRLKAGKFKNQPERWLWYVLRCKSGWDSSEIMPRRMGYRLTSGFVVRRKKTAASSTSLSCPAESRSSRDAACCLLLLAMAWLIARRPPSPSSERDWCSCCPECIVATLPPPLLRPKARSPPRRTPIAQFPHLQPETPCLTDARTSFVSWPLHALDSGGICAPTDRAASCRTWVGNRKSCRIFGQFLSDLSQKPDTEATTEFDVNTLLGTQ
jgi:hypothetical protein